MATRKEIIDLQVEYKSLEGLNAELAKTNKELEGTEIGSKKFNELSKSAQKLEAAVADVNSQIEGITAEKKFMAMDGAIKTMGGSVSAAVGSLGLLGIESEKFGEYEKYAASAIAFSMGIKDMSEGFKQLKDSTVLASAAQKAFQVATKAGQAIMKLFNITMAANPIGVLIVSLTAVGALIYAFRDKILNLIKTALGPFKGIVDAIAGAFTSLAEAVGLVDDEQTKQTKANIERMENELQIAQAKGEATIEMEKKVLQEKRKLLEEGTEEYKKSIQEEKVLDAKAQKEKADADKKASDEAAAKAKAANEKRLAERKAQEDKYLQLLKQFADEELNLQAKTDEQKLALDLQRSVAEIDALKVSEEKKAELKLAAEANYNTKLQELKDQQAEENRVKEEERRLVDEDRKLELRALEAQTWREQADAEIADVTMQYDRLIAQAAKNGEDTVVLEQIKAAKIKQINDDLADAEEKQEQEKQMVKEQALNATIDAAQAALTEIFGNSKAVASASVLVDAGQAAVGIIKASTSIPAPFNIPYQIAQFALLAATTASSLKQINSAKPGSRGTPSQPRPGAPRMAVGNQAPQPVSNQVNATNTPVQPVVKAYVLSGDARNAQEADAKLNKRRTLGS